MIQRYITQNLDKSTHTVTNRTKEYNRYTKMIKDTGHGVKYVMVGQVIALRIEKF